MKRGLSRLLRKRPTPRRRGKRSLSAAPIRRSLLPFLLLSRQVYPKTQVPIHSCPLATPATPNAIFLPLDDVVEAAAVLLDAADQMSSYALQAGRV